MQAVIVYSWRGMASSEFWQAGYEGADHVNGDGLALDPNHLNGHRRQVRADYAALARFGIREVRESIGWRLSTRDGRFDPSFILERLAAAREHGLRIGWTVHHYGLPPGCDVLGAGFPGQFAAFCRQVAGVIAPLAPGSTYVPVNEISFLTWALCRPGLMRATRDYGPGDAALLKAALVRAALAGVAAIRGIDPQARFMHVDPVIHVRPPATHPELAEAAAREVDSQYEAWDMLLGRRDPELGGTTAAVDLLGINYYHSNQWELGDPHAYPWHLRHPRRLPFSALLLRTWRRYGLPLLVAETSHVGVGRADWIEEVAAEVQAARRAGADIRGICLYPILDRVDWSDGRRWHNSGLWDIAGEPGPDVARRMDPAYAAALRGLGLGPG